MLRVGVKEGEDSRPTTTYQLNLPWTKTMKPGEKHAATLVSQNVCDPLLGIAEHVCANPAGEDVHAFAYYNKKDILVPRTKAAFMQQINKIWGAAGFAGMTGHSFRIGGANFYLDRGMSEEAIKLVGRWRSDRWKVYMRTRSETSEKELRIAASAESRG